MGRRRKRMDRDELGLRRLCGSIQRLARLGCDGTRLRRTSRARRVRTKVRARSGKVLARGEGMYPEAMLGERILRGSRLRLSRQTAGLLQATRLRRLHHKQQLMCRVPRAARTVRLHRLCRFHIADDGGPALHRSLQRQRKMKRSRSTDRHHRRAHRLRIMPRPHPRPNTLARKKNRLPLARLVCRPSRL